MNRPDAWWRARLWWLTGWFGPLVVIVLAGAVLLRWLPVHVQVQQLFAPGEATVPVALVVAGPIGIAVQSTLLEPSPQVWALTTGYRRWLRHVRVLLLIGVFLTAVALVAPAHLATASVVILTLAGEAILAGRFLGYRLAWLVPAAHAAISALMGTRLLIGLQWWAWPAEPNPTSAHVVVASAILVLGLIIEASPLSGTLGRFGRADHHS